jgi:tetratricopeptide (TPR) repeat protein
MVEKLIAIVCSIFVLFSGVSVVAQEETDAEVAFPTGYNQPNLTVIHTFFNDLKNELGDYSISLTVAQWSFENPDQSVDALFEFNFSANLFYVDIKVSPLREISPSLNDPSLTFTFVPLDQSVRLATGVILYSQGECLSARAYLQEALSVPEFSPNYAAVLQFLGNCSLLDQDYEEAIEYYESIPDIAHVDLCGDFNTAWTYWKLGENDLAFSQMDCGVLVTENADAGSLSRRAQLYALAYRYDDAITDLNTAIELDPDNPELYTLRGQMYLYLYKWDSSLADYNRAIELDPEYADAYYYRGVLYYSILQTGVELRSESLADFQHYLELAPDGDHAADSARYIDQIQTELAALNS